MTDPENENPYRPTGNEEPGLGADAVPELKTTAGEMVAMILIGIVVAIPVFFTTCFGGGMAIVNLGIGDIGIGEHVGNSEVWLVILSATCLVLAICSGFIVARWLKRVLRRKRPTGESE